MGIKNGYLGGGELKASTTSDIIIGDYLVSEGKVREF